MNATNTLKSDAKMEIEARVSELEKHTSAEVVCAIATESGRYDRAESLFGIAVSCIALFAAHLLFVNSNVPVESWGAPPALHVGWQALIVVSGFVVGSALASYCHLLRRPFVLGEELEHETGRAAQHVFSAQRLRSTRGSGGLLIYLSLFEQRIRLVADDGALKAVPEEVLKNLTDQVAPKLKANDVKGALMFLLDELAPRLADALPCDDPDNDNELANEVLVFHPRP